MTNWDAVAINERPVTTGLEEYTRHQMLGAFRCGLCRLPHKQQLNVLKVDLWTESAARQREVLSRMYPLAAEQNQNLLVHCMDISDHNCCVAHSYYPEVPICQATIEHLPYRDESFDLIFDPSTLDHLHLMFALHALSEYHRCLKPNGVLSLVFSHASGTFNADRNYYKQGIEYYTFPLRVIERYLNFQILERYSILPLNLGPLQHLASAAIKTHTLPVLFRLSSILEYSPVSKYLHGISPLYVIIARKR